MTEKPTGSEDGVRTSGMMYPDDEFIESAMGDALAYWNALPPEKRMLIYQPRRFGKMTAAKSYIMPPEPEPDLISEPDWWTIWWLETVIWGLVVAAIVLAPLWITWL